MQIKCPICGEICESDAMPAVGQHMLCPFCNGKFQYAGEYIAQPSKATSTMQSCTMAQRRGMTTKRAHKFCRECGNEINLKAAICPYCGVPVADRRFTTGDNSKVSNHMVEAILVTLFCCMIFGIIAIVYSSQVNTKLAQGDVAGAQAASKAAYGWIIASICVGIVGALLWVAGSVLSVIP